MSLAPSFRRTVTALLFFGVAAAAAQAGCGDGGGPTSDFPATAGEDASSGGPVPPPFGGDGSSDGASDADPDALGQLVVTPPTALIDVTITNGAITANAPVPFTASYSGSPVAATWLFDRGELGDVDASGVFTANGTHVGEGTLTARFGAREGTAKIKVVVHASSNGAPSGADAGGGSGGVGGVGGEPLGGAIPDALAARFKVEGTAPASAAELGFLYPYDATVWPRGLLAPLLMWQSTHAADAVYVKLSQGNFTFEGAYSYSSVPAGEARKRVHLEDAAWKTATDGNQGDDLKVEVKIHDSGDDKIYGPITESWKVASGVLKGTVYYNSYDSALSAGKGAVIAIQPRSPTPVLAVPSMAGKCHVCHAVSADGSTLWAEESDDNTDSGNYTPGASYDLTDPGKPRVVYDGVTKPSENRKFVWSAPYPDGSFALASSHWAREAYTQTDSKLFARSNGADLSASTTGLAGVVASAVTPSFSPDGRKVAFNFWEGAGAGGVVAGAGRSLAVMDFSCGAAAGSVSCAASPTYAFSNVREIYKDAQRWPAWPSFLPDGKAVVFNNGVHGGNCAPSAPNNTKDAAGEYVPYKPATTNCQLTTWAGATAELWWAADSATKDARRLDAANGYAGGASYLPTNADHPNDAILNYEPTVNPVASGGYYWVVFTSRRLYGNLITGKPWGADGFTGGPIKKLWVAAIDLNPAAGADPSHPAFYLPGQEIAAGNTRGFWVVDPCKPNGDSCETGDECCNGFCRKDPDGGALVCMDEPPGSTCSQEFEKCTVDADCCDPTQKCIAGKCSQGKPVVK